MKNLLVYLKNYKKEVVLSPVFKLLEAIMDLVVPVLIAAIIDNGIANNDSGYIIKISLLLLAIGIAGLGFAVSAQFFAAKAAVGFASRLRHRLFSHIQTLSFTSLDKIGPATLTTRMTADINQIQAGTNIFLRLVMRSPFIVFGAVIASFLIDWQMALVFAVAVPVLAAIVFTIILLSIPRFKRVQAALDGVLLKTKENLSGARVIRAFGIENSERDSFCEKNNTLAKIQKRVGKITALMNPMTYIVINTAVILLIYVGAFRVDAGALRQGQILAFYNYSAQILIELVKLANCIVTVSKAVASANRVDAVLQITDDTVRATDAEKADNGNAVEFQNVAFRYKGGGENALEGLNFSAKPGETIGIIGGTGSGKTTLVNLIGHFYDATDGAVFINGTDIRCISDDEIRKQIGYVMQKAVLFKGTIRENLLWGNENATEEQLQTAIAASQSSDIIASKEQGLDAMVEQGGKNFSGGQRQRLSIARALVRQPQILILDDSSSALDYATDARLRAAIKQLSPPPTVFVVSQRTSSIQYADKIIVLDDGAVVGIGTHEQLLENCEAYKEIYDSQFRTHSDLTKGGDKK